MSISDFVLIGRTGIRAPCGGERAGEDRGGAQGQRECWERQEGVDALLTYEAGATCQSRRSLIVDTSVVVNLTCFKPGIGNDGNPSLEW
jgi:hypothetical protein